jgi:hypothetical protein
MVTRMVVRFGEKAAVSQLSWSYHAMVLSADRSRVLINNSCDLQFQAGDDASVEDLSDDVRGSGTCQRARVAVVSESSRPRGDGTVPTLNELHQTTHRLRRGRCKHPFVASPLYLPRWRAWVARESRLLAAALLHILQPQSWQPAQWTHDSRSFTKQHARRGKGGGPPTLTTIEAFEGRLCNHTNRQGPPFISRPCITLRENPLGTPFQENPWP